MITRMESATELIALTVLRKINSDQHHPIQPETLTEAFRARWPLPGSKTPMNDATQATAQAASNCVGQDEGIWQENVSQAWQSAVKETAQEHLSTARENFREGELAQGAESLTDAVRTTWDISQQFADGPTARMRNCTAQQRRWQAAVNGRKPRRSLTTPQTTFPKMARG